MSDREIWAGIDISEWSDADKKSLRAACAAKAEADAALMTAQAARDAAESSPAAVIRKMQAEADAAQRELADDAEFEKAETQYGRGRVARLRTVEGSILLRAMTLEETDKAEARAAALQAPAERTTVHREALLDLVVYPSVAEVRKRVQKYPALWSILYVARDRLITGVEEEHEGKAVLSISKPAAR